jgi:hypothetical protein
MITVIIINCQEAFSSLATANKTYLDNGLALGQKKSRPISHSDGIQLFTITISVKQINKERRANSRSEYTDRNIVRQEYRSSNQIG